MSKELGGYGPTSGTYTGGSGGNLNERPDNSEPGGGSRGNAGDHSNTTNKTETTILNSWRFIYYTLWYSKNKYSRISRVEWSCDDTR